MASACHAEQAWKLCHGNGEARTCLETDQNTVADQPDQDTQPKRPGDEGKSGDGECRKACDLGVAQRIVTRHQRD